MLCVVTWFHLERQFWTPQNFTIPVIVTLWGLSLFATPLMELLNKKCRGIVFWFLMQSTLALRQPMMISREATMLSSRLAVLLSAFYHRLIIAHEASSFHCDAG